VEIGESYGAFNLSAPVEIEFYEFMIRIVKQSNLKPTNPTKSNLNI